MGYAVGDKIEYEYDDHTYTAWLIGISPIFQHLFETIWEVRRTRISHLQMIGENQIIRKISSNFEGYNKQLQKEKNA